jgi:NADPH:quinone reductase-like Zn-dependent oxidoreductase
MPVFLKQSVLSQCQRGAECSVLKGAGTDAQGGRDSRQGFLRAGSPHLLRGWYIVGLRWAHPQSHERVAVLGIGGLGHLAVQYAKANGFETIAVSHSPDKHKMIRDLGAAELVRDGKGLRQAGGADVILSTSNSTKAMVDGIQGLRPDGRLVTMAPTRSRSLSR